MEAGLIMKLLLLPLLVFLTFPALAQMPSAAKPPVQTAGDAIVKKFGKNCKQAGSCGDLVYVDCNSAADGPAYYAQKDTLNIVMRCGGFCMSATSNNAQGYCNECPPKEWTACQSKGE